MKFKITDITFVEYQPNLVFNKPDGNSYHWNKLEVADGKLNKFWISCKDELTETISAKLESGNKIEVSGDLEIFKGIPKFKANEIKQIS